MLFRSKNIPQLFLVFLTGCVQKIVYGNDVTNIVIYNKAPVEDWPDSYYWLYGFAVAAIVLFIISVMKKHDEIN